MTSKAKNGKQPLSSKKQKPMHPMSPALDFDRTRIEAPLQAELDKAGLVARWLDHTTYVKNGNMHPRGWRAYKYKGTNDEILGLQADGYITRFGMILGVKSESEQAIHRARLAAKAEANSGSYKAKSAELKEKAYSVGAKVHEGYEEEEGFKSAVSTDDFED